VDKVPGRNLVGLRIRNSENVQDKVVGICLRRRDQFKPDMVWDVLGKVVQGNARFALCDRLKVHLDNKKELLDYCKDDVNVLGQACCAIRKLFLKLVEMDPFRQAITNRPYAKRFSETSSLNRTL
jgi:hypothetical protein